MNTQPERSSPPLTPYLPLLKDCDARPLAERTLAWAEGVDLLRSNEAQPPEPTFERSLRLLVVASIFARFCSPHSSPERPLDVAARFLTLFLHADDDPAMLPTHGSLPWQSGRLQPLWRVWLSELGELGSCPVNLRESFFRSCRDCLIAIQEESRQDKKHISLEQHWSLRRRTIFVDPYLDQWLISLQVSLDQHVLEEFLELRRLAIDSILICNDLASLSRDEDGGLSPHDLNLIETYARVNGISRTDSLAHFLELHNRTIRRYRQATHEMLERASGNGAHVQLYCELVSSVIDGHRRTLEALPSRYPNSRSVLQRMDWAADAT